MGNFDNFITMAQNAADAKNYEEARTYYNKALELNTESPQAWFGKGVSEGWLSKINDIRFPEMNIAFSNAIKFSDNQEAMKTTIAEAMNEIAVACYSMCRTHVHEYVALPSTWEDFLSQCSQILSIYEKAHEYDPSNVYVLKNAILLCEENIQGIAYTDEYDNNTSKTVTLSPEYASTMRELLNSYGEILTELDPSYKIPNPVEVKPSSACFVVTATMGNESSMPVITLRKFRDDFLLKKKHGIDFVNWYYKNGPRLAKKIRNNRILMVFSFTCIVLPSVCIAKVIMLFSK